MRKVVTGFVVILVSLACALPVVAQNADTPSTLPAVDPNSAPASATPATSNARLAGPKRFFLIPPICGTWPWKRAVLYSRRSLITEIAIWKMSFFRNSVGDPRFATYSGTGRFGPFARFGWNAARTPSLASRTTSRISRGPTLVEAWRTRSRSSSLERSGGSSVQARFQRRS